MENPQDAFRLGDVRGIYPEKINEDFAYRFGRAFCRQYPTLRSIATGRDMRASSPDIHEALNHGLVDAGVEVLDLGLCATELGYFASAMEAIHGAIIVTASHNPAHYNGFKCMLSSGRTLTIQYVRDNADRSSIA